MDTRHDRERGHEMDADPHTSDHHGDGPSRASTAGYSLDDAGRVVWALGEFDDRAWRRLAACRDYDPAAFFPVGKTGPALPLIAEAKAVCRRCPVRLACLQFALTSNQEFGVWGGYDEDERRDLRRQWRRLGRPYRIAGESPPDPDRQIGRSSEAG